MVGTALLLASSVPQANYWEAHAQLWRRFAAEDYLHAARAETDELAQQWADLGEHAEAQAERADRDARRAAAWTLRYGI